MLRYRCPQCTQLLQAHELRAGKKSVCVACLSTHIVPIDRSAWLTETGEPLFPRIQTPAEPVTQSAAAPAPHPVAPVLEPVTTSSAVGSTDSPRVLPPDSPTSEPEEPRLAPMPGFRDPTSSPMSEGRRGDEGNTPRSATKPSTQHDAVSPAEKKAKDAIAVVDPIHVQTQAEIAAALTEVLTHRMKPPRHPRRDLRLSTAGWLVLTGLGVALLLVSLFASANYAEGTVGLGIVQILIGYGWIIWLTSHRDPKRGIVCAVPPMTFYYLGQWRYAKYRPLRFVVTGAALAGLALLAPYIIPVTRGWIGSGSHKSSTPIIDPADMSKLEKVREYKKEKAYDKLIDLLRDLTKTDSLKSVDAKDGPELATELKALCFHQDTGVKVAAMAAYTRWGGGEDARDICLTAIQSPSQEERMMAIQLLPQWKSTRDAPAVASAVASLIGRPGTESNRAETALVEIGGVAAERAALALLFRSKDDRTIRLVALSILERVGGNETMTALRSSADTELDQTIKNKTLETIEAIQTRLKKSPS
ncbi:MAG TPA: hypothetical protein VG122_02345 [Gemmata sp.]|nr:hypothetical protein [Gemmata sp.]